MGKTVRTSSGSVKTYKKKLFLINAVLFFIPAAYYSYQPLLRYSASLVIIDESPKKSDAIVVLAGGEPDRAWQAADLYNGGLAPYVVVTKDIPRYDEERLRNHGIEVVDGHGNYIRVLRGLGVPENRILTIQTPVEDTFTEIEQIGRLAEQKNWKSLIIVTGNFHTRRARLTARYLLGSKFDFTVVGSRYGGIDRSAWWRNNADLRTFLIEFEKLVAYTFYIWPRMIWPGLIVTPQRFSNF